MTELTISQRLAAVEQRIVEACRRGGRQRQDVTLVAVGKRQPIERLREAVRCGQRVFGESHVQEAVAKSSELPVEIEWHLIGPLQSNKTKSAVRLFDTIHSLDRLKIAQVVNEEAGRQGRRPKAFLQVRLGDEPSKHGFPETGLAEAVRPIADLPFVEIVGLMAIPPYEEDVERARLWFRRLRQLRDDLAACPEWAAFPGFLSMGMSHDFAVAIEEGATHVRVGSDLFGPRPAS